MKIVNSESWIYTLKELYKHGEILTNTGEYKTSEAVVKLIWPWMLEDYPELKNRCILRAESSPESINNEHSFILSLIPIKMNNNKQAKRLLERDY